MLPSADLQLLGRLYYPILWLLWMLVREYVCANLYVLCTTRHKSVTRVTYLSVPSPIVLADSTISYPHGPHFFSLAFHL